MKDVNAADPKKSLTNVKERILKTIEDLTTERQSSASGNQNSNKPPPELTVIKVYLKIFDKIRFSLQIMNFTYLF